METVIRNGALLKRKLESGETTVVIPEGIGSSVRRAVYHNPDLVCVVIPKGVRFIGKV